VTNKLFDYKGSFVEIFQRIQETDKKFILFTTAHGFRDKIPSSTLCTACVHWNYGQKDGHWKCPTRAQKL